MRQLKVGDLCKVLQEDTHTPCQQKDLVLITKKIGSVQSNLYVEGINLKTRKFHHYNKFELEVISESR